MTVRVEIRVSSRPRAKQPMAVKLMLRVRVYWMEAWSLRQSPRGFRLGLGLGLGFDPSFCFKPCVLKGSKLSPRESWLYAHGKKVALRYDGNPVRICGLQGLVHRVLSMI